MLVVARSVGRHSAVSPRDAVQQAWVKALSNTETKPSSIHDFNGFLTYMCALAKYEAMTNRQWSSRRQQREVAVDADIAECLVDANSLDALEAKLILQGPVSALENEEQELLHALYHDEKTIQEIKDEQQLAWTTLNSRKKRLLQRLKAALRAMVVMLLLVPKKARAAVAKTRLRASEMLVQATRIGGSIAITGACGLLLPTGLSFASGPWTPSGLTPVDTSETSDVKTSVIQPSFVHEVAPEEPRGLDAETNECSAVDMKFTKPARSVAENLIPMAFVLSTALNQAACAGTAQQTPPRQEEPEDEPDGCADPYEVACDQERARGNPCPPKEVWQKLGTGWKK